MSQGRKTCPRPPVYRWVGVKAHAMVGLKNMGDRTPLTVHPALLATLVALL
ncbi:hypothetical protein ACQ4M4_09905 [Leptolyngbya sp. AN02str]|uniref:hypothetical protein n=1 Tax=Leptolyngbya sp. AN02str TaxID=3423363 RepID=UPI003D311A25